MRVVRTENGRVRYHCRSKAQGLGCSGKGSFLDVYEEQVLADLADFTLPDDWRAWLLADAERRADDAARRDSERRRLEARLVRLRELYGRGDITREEYQSERDRLERELASCTPAQPPHDRLGAMARYLASLPAAWQDATAEQRNRLANLV
jgi:predicted RNA polymerase sigma factor